jgi:HSP20 family molecular chaperone IbpA
MNTETLKSVRLGSIATLVTSVHYVCNQAQNDGRAGEVAAAGRADTEETTMNSTDWITSHDLSLMFDPSGRLWHFRSTTHRIPIQATLDGTELVVTLATDGAQPGDFTVQLDGDVLEIHGAGEDAHRVVATVGLPRRVELHTLRTAYGDDHFEVRVPLVATAPSSAVEAAEPEAVPVAC